jgi:SAM-dependent methyltransferase
MKRIEAPATDGATFQLRHWEDRWQGWSLETIEAAIRWEGILPLARKAFPRGSKLLEAGCGTGKYCIALSRLGYDITGLDFAQSGLDVMHRLAPQLRGILGSVLDMPFEDGEFDGAISLGVVEHFEAGPSVAIAELHRVVRAGGTLLLTVPFHHRVHDLNERIGTDPATRGVFYQYLFRRDEMSHHLTMAGFDIHSVHYLGKQLGLSEFRLHKATNGEQALPVGLTPMNGKNGNSPARTSPVPPPERRSAQPSSESLRGSPGRCARSS